jgi:hypothetical protein
MASTLLEEMREMYLHDRQPHRRDSQQNCSDDQDNVHSRWICFQPVPEPLPKISLAVRPKEPLRTFLVQVNAFSNVVNHESAKGFVQMKVFLVFSQVKDGDQEGPKGKGYQHFC